jgi:hypothetical protein
MCYSPTVSVVTYIIGMTGCLLLYQKQFYVESLFLAFVIQMQLIEYFMWNNQPCNSQNITITKYGIVLNHLQPFVLWFLVYLFHSKQLNQSINIYMAVFGMITLFCIVKLLNNAECTTVTEFSKPYLYWSWNYYFYPYHNHYYVAFLLSFILLTVYGTKSSHIFGLIVFLGFISSSLIYRHKRLTGSMWCWTGAFIPWLLLIYDRYFV